MSQLKMKKQRCSPFSKVSPTILFHKMGCNFCKNHFIFYRIIYYKKNIKTNNPFLLGNQFSDIGFLVAELVVIEPVVAELVEASK